MHSASEDRAFNRQGITRRPEIAGDRIPARGPRMIGRGWSDINHLFRFIGDAVWLTRSMSPAGPASLDVLRLRPRHPERTLS